MADVNPDMAMNHDRKVARTVIDATRQAGIHVVHGCGSKDGTVVDEWNLEWAPR